MTEATYFRQYAEKARDSTIIDTPLSNLLPGSIAEFVSLKQDAIRKGTDQETKLRYQQVVPYVQSSLAIGRHLNRAIVLLLGGSGHGKSKTINTLVGKHVLAFARASQGSTTKVVQRLSVQTPDPKTGIGVMLSFDDTPGFGDTRTAHREWIEKLVAEYAASYYPSIPSSAGTSRGKTFPNVILLVSSWKSIVRDEANVIPIEETMRYLKDTALVDDDRSNVIVVVTKATANFEMDYEEFDSKEEKNKRWQDDANEKEKIINNIQKMIFPSSRRWPVVFLENGGGEKIEGEWRMLPNGQRGHQILFETILSLFSAESHGRTQDLVGLQALRYMTGDDRISSELNIAPLEILCKTNQIVGDVEGQTRNPRQSKVSEDTAGYPSTANPVLERFYQVARTRLGVSRNPISGKFGRISLVVLKGSDIEIQKCSSQRERMEHRDAAKGSGRTAHSELDVKLTVDSVAGVKGNYTANFASGFSDSSASHTIHVSIRLAMAKLTIHTPMLSNDVLQEIRELPPWDASSEKATSLYKMFFEKYGTELNVQASLGGTLRIRISHASDNQIDQLKNALVVGTNVPVAGHAGLDVGMKLGKGKARDDRKLSRGAQIEIHREGGGSVAGDLSSVLEHLFTHFQQLSSETSPLERWIDVRRRWIQAIETDPAFCADDPENAYMPMYELGGLAHTQKIALKHAIEWYRNKDVSSNNGSSEARMNGRKNTVMLDKVIVDAKKKWYRRLLFWRRSD